jgi:hypothetical protein
VDAGCERRAGPRDPAAVGADSHVDRRYFAAAETRVGVENEDLRRARGRGRLPNEPEALSAPLDSDAAEVEVAAVRIALVVPVLGIGCAVANSDRRPPRSDSAVATQDVTETGC